MLFQLSFRGLARSAKPNSVPSNIFPWRGLPTAGQIPDQTVAQIGIELESPRCQRFEGGGWGQACERRKQVESIIQGGAAQRGLPDLATFAEDSGGRSQTQTRKTALRQTCDKPGKAAWKPAANEHGNAGKPAANCGSLRGILETCRKHTETRQEPRRKFAGDPWKTWKTCSVETCAETQTKPAKHLGKETREGNLYEAQSNLQQSCGNSQETCLWETWKPGKPSTWILAL